MEHTFQPDPDLGDAECTVCGMPRSNRRHPVAAAPPPAVVEQAVAALRSTHVQESLDATPASHTAAAGARLKAGSTRTQVLVVIHEAGERGITDAELFAALDRYGPNTLRPRRNELVTAGLIAPARDDRGQVLYRDGSTVWTVTHVGRLALSDVAA